MGPLATHCIYNYRLWTIINQHDRVSPPDQPIAGLWYLTNYHKHNTATDYWDYCFALSGSTGKALVWHTRGLVFEPRLLQQVLRFVGRVYTVELRGAQGVLLMRMVGCDQSNGSTVSDAFVRSWLWSTAHRSSPLGTSVYYCM